MEHRGGGEGLEAGTSGENGQVEKSPPCRGLQVHRPGADLTLPGAQRLCPSASGR